MKNSLISILVFASLGNAQQPPKDLPKGDFDDPLDGIKAQPACGPKVITDAAQCGVETVVDGVKCGTEIVEDAIKCGTKWVTSAALCGTQVVKDGAVCGFDTITSGAVCGWNIISSAFECVFRPSKCRKPKSCRIPKSCKKPLRCKVPNKCRIPLSCELPKSCEIESCKQLVPGGVCDPLFQECDIKGFSCQLSFDKKVFRCLPSFSKDMNVADEKVCNALRTPKLVEIVKNFQTIPGLKDQAMTFSVGSGGGVGVAGSVEVGLAYGPNGEYGCFRSECTGFTTDATIASYVTVARYAKWDDIAGESEVVSANGSSPGVEIDVEVGTIFSKGFSKWLGAYQSTSIGLGILPGGASYMSCNTQLFQTKG